MKLPFKAIAAMAENRVIGRGAEIPWHLPEDFKFFKRTTMGHVLVMGRKTFESIGRPLPGRETVVLSRRGVSYPGVRCVGDLSALSTHSDEREVFICGGAEIYRQALPFCSELFLTHVKQTVEGDARFPEFEAEFHRVSGLMETPDFEVVLYRNNQLA